MVSCVWWEMKRLSSFGFVPQTASDQSRKREGYSSSSVSNEKVHDDESTLGRRGREMRFCEAIGA